MQSPDRHPSTEAAGRTGRHGLYFYRGTGWLMLNDNMWLNLLI